MNKTIATNATVYFHFIAFVVIHLLMYNTWKYESHDVQKRQYEYNMIVQYDLYIVW